MTLHRLFWPATVCLLACMAAAMFTSALEESDTWDEGAHLVSGYAYWKTGSYAIGADHPPLGRLWEALPLVALDLTLPQGRMDQPSLGRVFLYHNRVPAETILALARSMTMLLTLALGLALAWWTRAHFGSAAALAAVTLFAFDPNFLAHGRYTTNDVIVALFYFLCAVCWQNYLTGNRRRWLAATGVVAGLALLSKTSAFVALPLFALLYAVFWYQQRCAHCSFGHMVRSLACVFAIAAAIVLLFYLPDAWHTWPPTLVHALDNTITKSTLGHQAYLFGQVTMHGWWYYFPVAMAVKSTSVVVVLLLAGLFGLARRPRIEFRLVAVVIAAALFLTVAMAARINIGVRHILPIYPLVYAACGVMIARWARGTWRASLAATLLLAHAAESAAIYPHYLAFFNVLSGGPSHGTRYLSDSNIDWGQDAKHLRAYLETHRIDDACICYFGNADFAYYRIKGRYLPPNTSEADLKRLDCVAAVSVTPLSGLYVPPNGFAWLRRQIPIANVGYSIYIYDLRKKAAP